MGEVALLAGSGMAVAIPVALAFTRLIKSRLFGLATSDPQTFAGAVIVLGLVAALAGYVPARRATRVDPISALRYE
jgi:ABC-type antimicrobial peptide transport system permease subunit